MNHERGLWIIASIFLLSRLLLLPLNEAEFTDGYLILNWSIHDPSRWHPLYPLIVKIFATVLDPILAGRIVSLLAGLFTLMPLAALANALYSRRTAFYACCFYTASPLVLWADTRVLTESLFLLLTLTAVYFWIQIRSQRNALASFVFCSGLAVLTRPEGLVFTPLVLVALYQAVRRNFRTLTLLIAASFPWILFALWSTMDSHDSYREVMLQNFLSLRATEDLLTRVVAYLDVYPYIFFYPLFALSVYGLLTRYSELQRRWLTVLVYLHVCWFAALSIHASWSTRFLLLPSSLLFVPAAAGFENLPISQRTSRFLLILLMALLIAFSGVAFERQRKTFADFKQVVTCVANRSPKGRILSDENIKTEYYLRRSVEVYTRAEPLVPGDVLILHSFNTNLSTELQYLEGKYEVEFLCMNESEVVPILANGVLEKIELTNSQRAVHARFTRQRFRSIALEVKKPLRHKDTKNH